MALDLVSASTEYVEGATPVIETDMPFSMGCWFNPDGTSGDECLISLSDASATTEQFMLLLQNSPAALKATERGAGGAFQSAVSTITVSAGVWQHGLAVFTSTTSRTVYLDGGNANTNTSAGSSINIDKMTLGRLGDSTPNWEMDGKLAEVAVWNVALTAEDAAMLAAGFSPRFIRPGNLVFYMPLITAGVYNDLYGGIVFTTVGGTPTTVQHPPIITPESVKVPAIAIPVSSFVPAPQIILAG